PVAVPDRGGGRLGAGRRNGRGAGRRDRPGRLGSEPERADAAHLRGAGLDPAGVRRVGRDRRVLRHLPGRPGGPAEPHRGTEVRMTKSFAGVLAVTAVLGLAVGAGAGYMTIGRGATATPQAVAVAQAQTQ